MPVVRSSGLRSINASPRASKETQVGQIGVGKRRVVTSFPIFSRIGILRVSATSACIKDGVLKISHLTFTALLRQCVYLSTRRACIPRQAHFFHRTKDNRRCQRPCDGVVARTRAGAWTLTWRVEWGRSCMYTTPGVMGHYGSPPPLKSTTLPHRPTPFSLFVADQHRKHGIK